MAILVKIHKASENTISAIYTFQDETKLNGEPVVSHIAISKETGTATVIDSPSNRLSAMVIHKLLKHWEAQELPEETSFAA